jgi:hypothetical protein
LALSKRLSSAAETVDCLFMLYIDNHHDLLHGQVSESNPLSWFESIGNWSMLGSVISCVRTGLSIHQRKIVWASKVPSKALDIVIDLSDHFLPGAGEVEATGPDLLEYPQAWGFSRPGG